MTENENSRLRGNLLIVGGILMGGGLMLGVVMSYWPTECSVTLTDKVGVVHEYVTRR